MKNSAKLDAAANALVDLIEQHLAKLSPAERAARWRAFHKSAATLRRRAKSRKPLKTRR